MEITKKPFKVAFAGNPMRYLLSPETGGGGGWEETLSIVQIEFTAIDDTPNHTMTVAMMAGSRSFTLKADPTDKDHLPVADSAWNAARWAQACYEYILNDAELVGAYEIGLDAAIITLIARVASEDYDWSVGSSTITGVTITTLQGGAAGTPGTVEGVRMQVWKNGTTKIGEDYKPLEASGTVKFEVQEYIYASLLMAEPPRFHLVAGSAFAIYWWYADYQMKYRTVFCDKVDGEFSPRTYTDPDNSFCYALPGGLNREDLVANNAGNVNWFNLTATKKKFLTWTPPSRVTDKSETHSLFFIFQDPAYASFRYKANLFTAETGSQVYLTNLIGINQFTMIELLAGYDQLQLGNYHQGAVIRWQLYLVDPSDNIISDVREFSLDDQYHENIRYFRFRNSWGTYDSFRCTGVVEAAVEHDREKVAYASDETETAYNAPGSYTMIKEAQSFKANSGWLSKEYLNYLRDFMLSADIYEVEDGRLLKCLLTSKKTAMWKDKSYNYSLAFEYERGYEDFFFQGLE